MLSTDPGVRQSYSADVSGLVMTPDAVARPTSPAEVEEIVRRAAADGTPVTAAGGQTSTTGASICDKGVLLSLRAMDKVIDVDAAGRRAIVEPGVLLGELNRRLAPMGLHFAPDPTSEDDVTIGGAVACNASGARTLLYGATRRHVLALKVVLANGTTIEVRRSGLDKNTAGYAIAQDPVDWFVGSEGTLGVIVQAELALTPLPPRVVGLALPCKGEEEALALVASLRASSRLHPRCIEYFDEQAFGIARDHSGGLLPNSAAALLYVEDVAAASGEPDLDEWVALTEASGALSDDLLIFDGDAALRDARRLRHSVPATMNERGAARRSHGGRKVSTDWAVPLASFPGAIAEARRLVEKAGIAQPVIYGHAGNGHPHQNFIAADADELTKTESVVEATLKYVLSLGGTVSAEHGIGKIKRKWLPLQATPLQIGVMRALKRELDPQGILAPGNIL